MLSNESSLDCDEDLLSSVSSGSSSSKIFQETDIKKPTMQVNREWEAIERTLYQETGEQVTDPELLKECRLWREAFPHLRVKGTKMSVNETVAQVGEHKNVQTLNSHIGLNKLQEKREMIKNKVVDELVERLVAKFNLNNKKNTEKLDDVIGSGKTGVAVSEIHDDPSDSTSKPLRKSPQTSSGIITLALGNKKKGTTGEKECYFERGKPRKDLDEDLSLEKLEGRISEIFQQWEISDDVANPSKSSEFPKRQIVKSYSVRNSDFANIELNPPRGEKIGLKLVHKPTSGFKKEKLLSRSDYLSNQIKPVEIANKIDKKYEKLLDKIMERRYNDFEATNHCRALHKADETSELTYQKCLEKLRINSGFNDFYKKSNLPKISKHYNNWLERGEIHRHRTAKGEGYPLSKAKCAETVRGNFVSEKPSQSALDEKFMRDLKREVQSNSKRPPTRSGVVEEINWRKPKPFLTLSGPGNRSLKSSSCGNLPHRNKRESQSRPWKTGLQNEKNEKNRNTRLRSNNSQNTKRDKTSVNACATLPPIDTGIICTELIGRPKIGPKIPPKRR